MDVPAWFKLIKWNAPVALEALRANRSQIPAGPGVYVFTNYPGPLQANLGVLYVGKAKSLHTRLQSYLVDPSELMIFSPRAKDGKLNRALRHPGKVALLVKVQQRCRGMGLNNSGIWVRWTECFAPGPLEDQMIKYLQPAFNTNLL